MTGLPISTIWKRDSNNSILVIVDWLIKLVHYEPVKITINAPGLAEVIIDVVVCHHGFLDSINTDKSSLFTSKFWSLLCYFLGLKRKLSNAFHPQTDRQTELQDSTIEAYLQAFINFKHNDWVKFLLMAEFAYNNAKNASTGHTPFELNSGYHLQVFYEEDIDPRYKPKSVNKLLAELQELITVCRKDLYHA